MLKRYIPLILTAALMSTFGAAESLALAKSTPVHAQKPKFDRQALNQALNENPAYAQINVDVIAGGELDFTKKQPAYLVNQLAQVFKHQYQNISSVHSSTKGIQFYINLGYVVGKIEDSASNHAIYLKYNLEGKSATAYIYGNTEYDRNANGTWIPSTVGFNANKYASLNFPIVIFQTDNNHLYHTINKMTGKGNHLVFSGPMAAQFSKKIDVEMISELNLSKTNMSKTMKNARATETIDAAKIGGKYYIQSEDFDFIFPMAFRYVHGNVAYTKDFKTFVMMYKIKLTYTYQNSPVTPPSGLNLNGSTVTGSVYK